MSRRSSVHRRIAGMLRQIALAAADQTVDHAHRDAATAQQIDHMRADEAGAAGHHRAARRAALRRAGHAACFAFSVRTLK